VGPQAPLFNFIPGHWIHDIGVVLFVIVGLSAVLGVASMASRFISEQRRKGIPLRLAALPGAIVSAVTDALMHRRFQRCDSAEATPPPAEPWYLRAWVVHAAVMGGFLTMLLATTLDFLLKPIGSPVPPWYPMRIMGLVGGLVCLYALVIIFQRRMRASQIPWKKSSFSDWFFPSLLAATVLTGILTELAVYAPLGYVGHAIFFTHVVLAMDLVAMLPLTKFAHVLYRTLALTLFAWRHAPVPEHVTAKAQV
jgi:nitrate reductase gamma subunit